MTKTVAGLFVIAIGLPMLALAGEVPAKPEPAPAAQVAPVPAQAAPAKLAPAAPVATQVETRPTKTPDSKATVGTAQPGKPATPAAPAHAANQSPTAPLAGDQVNGKKEDKVPVAK